MEGRLRKAFSGSGIAALALATAACGPEEAATTSAPTGQFSLFDSIGSSAWPGGLPEGVPEFSEADYFDDALPPMPRAAPMARAAPARSQGYAPDYYDDYPAGEPVYYDEAPSDNSYAWLALASSLGGVLGDAPPDYYFDYDDGVDPWVWETGDNFVRYAEPLDHGYRYYYYSPGRSSPFLVRDPDYSYGYYDNRVAVIYDRDGRVLDGRRSWRHRQVGERYYARARDLHQASRLRPRHGIAAPLWDQRRTTFAREQRQWDDARTQRAGWRGWDRRNDRTVTPRWNRERVARTYAAQRFDRWRDDGYRGQAPRFYAEAERNPRLQRAVQRQRVEQRAGFAQRRDARWQAAAQQRRGQAGERNAFRDQARQQRLAAQPSRDRDWAGRSPRHEAERGQGLTPRNDNRSTAATARREASRQQLQAFRGERQQEARSQQRSQVRSQARQEARSQRVQTRVQRSQAMSGDQARGQAARAREEARRQGSAARSQGFQARQEARAQRQPQARDQSRTQRAQAMSQARQQRVEQRQVRQAQARQPQARQVQPRRDYGAQRQQARQDVRAQQRQVRQTQVRQTQVRQAEPRRDNGAQRQQVRQEARAQQRQVRAQSGNGGGREARVAERTQRGGHDRRMQ